VELWAWLIEAYENERHPIEPPTPLEAIRFRMEQQGLEPKDLVPFIGSRSKVSEVLSGKRSLSLRMIRALHSKLGIPAEVLIGAAA
jgi:HTH-type transcriptional regulator/antitoxin HigA